VILSFNLESFILIIKTVQFSFSIKNKREHEWDKHGTCALGLRDIYNESDYFNRTLNLRNTYDFGPYLKAGSVVPDDTILYDVSKIENAVKSKLNVVPWLTCYILKDSKVQYLSQMQICMDIKFQIIECNDAWVELSMIQYDNTPQETKCNPNLPIHYPTLKYVDNKTR
jgi:ribonuclease I